MHQLNRHNAIRQALTHFNSEYLADHNILFGGGTRIALELGEFRESLLCGLISLPAIRT